MKHLYSTGRMGHPSGEYDYGYSMFKAQCQWLEKSDEMQFIEVWTSQVRGTTYHVGALSLSCCNNDTLSYYSVRCTNKQYPNRTGRTPWLKRGIYTMETLRNGSNRWLPHSAKGCNDEPSLMHHTLKKPILVDGVPPSRGLRLMFNSASISEECVTLLRMTQIEPEIRPNRQPEHIPLQRGDIRKHHARI